jgi:hypothetical protein
VELEDGIYIMEPQSFIISRKEDGVSKLENIFRD